MLAADLKAAEPSVGDEEGVVLVTEPVDLREDQVATNADPPSSLHPPPSVGLLS